jgi:hypothetical protein
MSLWQNWDSILAVAIVIILDAAAVAKMVLSIINKVMDDQADERAAQEEEDKADQTTILRKIIFSLVTEAERALGSGTGKLKLAKVTAWVYEKIPDDMKSLFSAQDIEDMIEDVLKDAQAYWETNEKAKEYIESGDVATLITETTEIQTGAAVEDIVAAVGACIGNTITEAAKTATDAPTDTDDELPADGD